MIRRSAPVLLALVIVAAPFAPARADGDSVARTVAGSDAEARGDFDAWLAELVAAVAGRPESPYAMAALDKIEGVMVNAADPSVVEKTLDPVLVRGVRDGEIDEKLRDVLAARARARGDFERADKYGGNRGYLRRFAAAGVFGSSNPALVHRKYAPEKRDLDPAAAMDGQWGPVRWTPLPILGADASVAPRSQVRRGDGVVYALGRVKSAAARTVAIKIFCRDSFAVMVNGAATIVADRRRDQVPAMVWATTRLEPGWNRVLVKVAGSSPFGLKLCDPATGLPVQDVEEGDPLVGAELPTATGETEPRAYLAPDERALADAGSDPAARAAAAFLCDQAGRGWDAYAAFDAAAAAVEGADAALAGDVHAACGRFLANFRELPEIDRKLRAKTQYQAAVKAYPAHNSAAVRLAEYENDEDHPDKAAKALREQIKARPTPTAWMALARVSRQREWEKEAIDAATQALKIAPNHVEATKFLLAFDAKYGAAAQVAARTKRLLEIDADDGDATSETVAQLRAQGKQEEALALVRALAARRPGALGWRTQAATILQALGRDDEALAEWRALARLVPQDASYPRAVAAILEAKGDAAGAIENYRKSLACEPFQPDDVWRPLARLEGKDADFAAPYEPNVDEMVAKLPSTEELKAKYGKAVAVTLLDHCVTRVREDGSSQSYVHMVWKLLDEKAREKYGSVRKQGDLRAIRAILPDGRVMEPTGVPGQAYAMEGLVPGAVVDYRSFQSRPSTPKGYDGGSFVFQDSEFNAEPNPVLLSRLVVISPESMKLAPVKRNFDGDPKVETKDGCLVTTWEKRDMPRVEPERFMPDTEEVLPIVDYSLDASYDDVNWTLLARVDDTRPTPILADEAAKVVKEGMTDVEKLRALYDHVNEVVTGQAGGAEGPTATLLAKAGNRGRLFEALVRAAGIPYERGNAMPWNGGQDLPVRPDASVFGAPFLLLEPRGAAPIPFVMLERLAPFALLPEHYRGSAAYIAGESGGRIVRLPQGGLDDQDWTRFEIRLGADAKGTKISGEMEYRDASGYAAKRRIIEASEDDRRKRAEGTVSGYFASPTLEKFDFPGLETRGVPLRVTISGSMADYLQPQGDTFVAALGLPRMSMSDHFVERAERVYDLVTDVRDDRLDEFSVVVGDAFRLTSLPEDHVVFNRLGTYSLTWRNERGIDGADRIVVRREAHLHPARYRPDEYKAFAAWCKSIDDAEDRKLEFRKVKQVNR